ncbi:MAG: hypothetical protein ACT443_03630 [Gemmatimonadota bacterium]
MRRLHLAHARRGREHLVAQLRTFRIGGEHAAERGGLVHDVAFDITYQHTLAERIDRRKQIGAVPAQVHVHLDTRTKRGIQQLHQCDFAIAEQPAVGTCMPEMKARHAARVYAA